VRPNLRIALSLAPALLLLGGLFFGGIAIGVARTLGLGPNGAGLNFAAYAAVLSDPDIYRSLGLSVWIAGASTVIAALIALPAALMLRYPFRGRGLAGFLFQVNLTIPHLVGAIGILYLFSQSGSFARAAAGLGLIARPAEFPALVYDPAALGVIFTYVWKEVPFVGLVVLAALLARGPGKEEAARTLGASRWQVLRHVTIRSVMPSLVSASAIVFAFAFGAYEVPAMLGASVPQALPVVAYRLFTDVEIAARLEAGAVAHLIALVSVLMLVVALGSLRRAGGRLL